MKISKVILNIESVVCFIFGALYSFSLVFIPVGVYCFIAGRRFSYKAEHLDNDMFLSNKHFKYYVVFASIACFPLGLLSIIPYVLVVGNRIRITNDVGLKLQKDDETEEMQPVETIEGEEKQTQEAVIQKDDELTDEEKQAKFEKLQNFKDKGIITEEELEQAREQLFGKK